MAVAYEVTSPAPRDVWRELMARDGEAVPYQSSAWVDSICASGKFADASRLYEGRNGRQFLLPLVRRKGLPSRLTSAASLPAGWGMGGLLASEPVDIEDVRAVFADLNKLPFARIFIRANPRLGALWASAAPATATAIPRLAHILNLEGGFDHVWSKRFNKNTRSAVRKAEASGVEVETDVTGRLLPEFYDLLGHSFERWAFLQNEPAWLTRFRGQLRDPKSKFETIVTNLGEACRMWVARVDGKPAAAIMVIQYGNANYMKAAMDREVVGVTQANVLLLKLAIEEACRAGCRFFHMGETGGSASLAQFKKRFGAEAYPYEEYYLERVPFTKIDAQLRRIVKRAIGFKDMGGEPQVGGSTVHIDERKEG